MKSKSDPVSEEVQRFSDRQAAIDWCMAQTVKEGGGILEVHAETCQLGPTGECTCEPEIIAVPAAAG